MRTAYGFPIACTHRYYAFSDWIIFMLPFPMFYGRTAEVDVGPPIKSQLKKL